MIFPIQLTAGNTTYNSPSAESQPVSNSNVEKSFESKKEMAMKRKNQITLEN